MVSKTKIAYLALNDALKFRMNNGGELIVPLDIFQFSTNLGIDVRFVDYPSLEAMYVKDKSPKIIISSQRPYGRQVFDCAHELGHHFYGHGSKIDEYKISTREEGQFEPEEFAADCFAGFLLMPKTLINHAFAIKGLSINECSELDFYAISNWIGVGYTTLISHMVNSLRILTPQRAKQLQAVSPKTIRQRLIPNLETSSVILVDYFWVGRAIDVQIGDYVILPSEVLFNGEVATKIDGDNNNIIYQANTHGVGRFYSSVSSWAAFIRVSRKGYVGRSIFRHLEDPEYV